MPIRRYGEKTAVREKGQNGQKHFGFIALFAMLLDGIIPIVASLGGLLGAFTVAFSLTARRQRTFRLALASKPPGS